MFAHYRNMVVVHWCDKAKNKLMTVLSMITSYRGVGGSFAIAEINQHCCVLCCVDLSIQHHSYYTVSTRRDQVMDVQFLLLCCHFDAVRDGSLVQGTICQIPVWQLQLPSTAGKALNAASC